MKKKLNNKGYMLVEIIVASVIAFSVAYYLLNLTYKFKDKNMDVYEFTALLNDKINITKNIMNDLVGKECSIKNNYNNEVTISCTEDLTTKEKKLSINKETHTIEFGDYKKKLPSYIEIEDIKIEGNIIIIPIKNIYNKNNYNIKIIVLKNTNNSLPSSNENIINIA